jgi:hypothetical protein
VRRLSSGQFGMPAKSRPTVNAWIMSMFSMMSDRRLCEEFSEGTNRVLGESWPAAGPHCSAIHHNAGAMQNFVYLEFQPCVFEHAQRVLLVEFREDVFCRWTWRPPHERSTRQLRHATRQVHAVTFVNRGVLAACRRQSGPSFTTSLAKQRFGAERSGPYIKL